MLFFNGQKSTFYSSILIRSVLLLILLIHYTVLITSKNVHKYLKIYLVEIMNQIIFASWFHYISITEVSFMILKLGFQVLLRSLINLVQSGVIS